MRDSNSDLGPGEAASGGCSGASGKGLMVWVGGGGAEVGTGGKWMCQARGQEGPGWLVAKGQAARQTPSGEFWRCFGGQGAG